MKWVSLTAIAIASVGFGLVCGSLGAGMLFFGIMLLLWSGFVSIPDDDKENVKHNIMFPPSYPR